MPAAHRRLPRAHPEAHVTDGLEAAGGKTGALKVCSEVTQSVPSGTTFSFTVSSAAGPVAAFTLAPGTCWGKLDIPAVDYTVTQTVNPSIPVTEIMGDPAGVIVASNLATGTSTLLVPDGIMEYAIYYNTPVAP